MALIRRPRFQRSPVALPFKITQRDIEIIRQIFKHRFLNSAQVAQLVSGSRQHTLRRLQALYHHGYLDRPRCQIDHFTQLGTRPLIYGLGNKGARLLDNVCASQMRRLRWSAKNSAAQRIFLNHALQVADIMIAFELACRGEKAIRFIPTDQLSLTTALSDTRPLRWNVSFAEHEITLIPDAVFALDVHETDGHCERIHYFLEADRGTMPVIRKQFGQTSLLRKLLAYEATWSQGVHRTVLGIDRFRVLTVTTSGERVEHLRDVSSRLQRGHGLFLFSHMDALHRTHNLFSLSWITAKQSPATSTLFS